MRSAVIAAFVALLTGCGEQVGRYQIAAHPDRMVWRLDTRTGDLELCGFDFGGGGKMTCLPFPKAQDKKS